MSRPNGRSSGLRLLDCLRSRAKRQWPETFRGSLRPKMPQSTKNFVWLAVLCMVAPLIAAIIFYFPEALAKPRLWVWGFILTPVLWGVALGVRRPLSLALLKIHAALISALLLLSIGSAIVGFGFFLAILGVDGFLARITSVRIKESGRDINHPKFVYLGLTASIFGGCFVGIQLWSSTLPPRIVYAAETMARDLPYCIEVDGRPARNAGQLTGLSMQARRDGVLTFNFHGLLVIETSRPHDAEQHITPGEIHRSGKASFGEWKPPDRIYLNWSYRSGRFEPVSHHASDGLHLDAQVKCTPVAHFARDWV
jgi:hypothetical protein